MTSKKKSEARRHAAQKKQTERIIRIVGAVVLGLVLVVIVWALIPRDDPNVAEATPEATVNAAAGATAEAVVDAYQYNAPPPMTIDPDKKYFATFKMEKGGEFTVELFADKAPKTVNNFVFLAREGYYDDTTFHRVLEGFMAQGGDRTGTGMGGPGYEFADEFGDLTFDKPGLLAMANSGPNTNGSQFFITFAPTPWLDGLHTIFGQVTEGMDVVNALTLRDPNTGPSFAGDKVATITITEE